MKKILFLVLFIAMELFAETKMEYEISFVSNAMDYREYDKNNEILDSESSDLSEMLGVEFKYRFYFKDSSHIELSALGVSGDTKYKGSYFGSGDPYGSLVSTTKNDIYNIALFYKMENETSFERVKMHAGLGIGYKFWQRELQKTQIEQYYWYSLRANVGISYNLGALVSMLEFEYQYGIDPQMSATGFSEDFDLGGANIMLISIPLRYEVSKNLDLLCAYNYEYQIIDASNSIDGAYEPDSTAKNHYLKFGVIFKY